MQAQKPWAKKYTKLMKTKKEFHQACRAEKSAINQENNARADSSVSQDNVSVPHRPLQTVHTTVLNPAAAVSGSVMHNLRVITVKYNDL